MTVRNIYFGIGLLAVLSNVAILILIMASLDRRGYKTNMLVARICPFKYLTAYKEATRKETGKIGPLYGLWILTINLTLAAALAGFLSPIT